MRTSYDDHRGNLLHHITATINLLRDLENLCYQAHPGEPEKPSARILSEKAQAIGFKCARVIESTSEFMPFLQPE